MPYKEFITSGTDRFGILHITRSLAGVRPAQGLLLAGLMLLANAALSQEGSGGQSLGLEEVVVTGSRIQNPNLVGSTPVTQIAADEFQYQGTVRVEDTLRNIPQVWSGQNAGQSNDATGTATVNLRNLGSERTLVLINSRRMPAGSPLQGGVGADINQVPGALIERVEILTGGASAIYGSDAVAGVVNFLLKDDFEGIRLDYQASAYQHNNDSTKWRNIVREAGYPVPTGSVSDGETQSLSLLVGGNLDGGRGNVTAYATYRKIDPVLQSARDYSACALNKDASECEGSGTTPEGTFAGGLQAYLGNVRQIRDPARAGITDPETGLPDEGYLPLLLTRDVDDPSVPLAGQTVIDSLMPQFTLKVAGNEFVDAAGNTYNYGPLNYYQRPDERYTFGAFAHYEVNQHFEAHTELMFMDDRSVSQIAPSGAFGVTDTLNCENPLLSAQQKRELCGQYLSNAALINQLTLIRDNIGGDNDLPDGLEAHPLLGGEDGVVRQAVATLRRNVEGGSRQQDLRHTSFRMVFGGRGDIDNNWRYDLFAQYAEVSMESTYLNDLSITRIERALDVVANDDGEPVCRTALPGGADPDCVPWNIFETGGVTEGAVNYLVLPLFSRGGTDQTVVSGYFAGNLGDYGWRLPLAETGVNVAFGLEYREENLEFNPDNGFRNGDGAGQGGATPAVSGGYDVAEFFIEANVPILEGQPFAESLILDASYRRSNYSYEIETDTYGIRTGWAINNTVRLRASYQRAVRGPNVREFFLPEGFSLAELSADPCGGELEDGETESGRTLTECMRSGVTEAQFGNIRNNPASQYNFLQGGRSDLVPEESDSYSIGAVFTPEAFLDLRLSIDYFEIKVEKGIDNLTPELILNECLDGNLAQCDKVKRSIAGDLWVGSDVERSGHIVSLQENLAIEEVQGIDINAEWSVDAGAGGSVDFSNATSIITAWDRQELEGTPTVNCKGKWNNVCGYPTPDLQNNLRITWVTPWDFRPSLLWRHIGTVDDFNENIDLDSADYLDLAAVWGVSEKLALRAGVNNVLDAEPPGGGAAAGPSISGNGNTFPGIYDALGRYLFAAVSLEF